MTQDTTPTSGAADLPEALIYAELPKHAATGLGEEYESFDQNGKPMGKAYQNLVYYTEDQMRAFADATHTLRASYGQAPADAKALAEADRRAGEAERLLATCKEEVMRFEQVRSRMKYQWGVDQRVLFDEIWDEALALKKAAQTGSVQEDAALWHWLAEYLVGTRTDLDDEIVASETVNDLRKIVEAARKQGASHDR